jgi:hypothetical protein
LAWLFYPERFKHREEKKMGNTKAKVRIALFSGLGALMLAGSVLTAGVANAATYSGKWSLTAFIEAVHNTASYKTNSTHKVSSCVSVTSTGGVGGVWSFQLTWVDGGKNKVLWHSGDMEGKARVCSPVEKPGANDRIYDHIILINAGAGVAVQDSGTYTFNTC